MHKIRLICITVCLYLYWAMPIMAQMRLVLDAEVNSNRVRLLFDTGAEATCLFKNTAIRLNLKVTEPDPSVNPVPGAVLMGLTEECTFSLSRINRRTRLPVYDPPNWVDYGVDGILAWTNVSDHIFSVSLNREDIGTLIQLPEDIASWSKWNIGLDKRLTLQVKKPNGNLGSILIDTGSPLGVNLNATRWENWRNVHSENPAALGAYFAPAGGLVIREECWANRVDIETFSLTDVPVMQSGADVELSYENYEADLGLFALSGFDIIIDGANNHFYTKPIEQKMIQYSYNRLGAIFVPNSMGSKNLVAHVVEGSPAWTAGIRNGDILLGIDNLDVTKWRTDPNVLPLARFWNRSAGTHLNLSVIRNGTPQQVTVILCEILQGSLIENSSNE